MDTPIASRLADLPATRSRREGDFLHDVVMLLGGDLQALGHMAGVPVAVRRLAEGSALVHEGAPLQCLHIVRCGSLKCSSIREDGYEQVTALALPGDVLGFDGLHSGHHATTDVALELCTVYALPLPVLQSLTTRCPNLNIVLQRALSRQLARAVATADMLAPVASDVRLARFILWLSTRARELGWSPSHLRLSLCRRDLASLLGVAHETVCRSFSTLADAGLLEVANREIEILDAARLGARARTTRRPCDAGAVGLERADRPVRRTRQPVAGRWASAPAVPTGS